MTQIVYDSIEFFLIIINLKLVIRNLVNLIDLMRT